MRVVNTSGKRTVSVFTMLMIPMAKPVPSSSPRGTAISARMTNSVTSTVPTSRCEKPTTRNVASSLARSAREMRLVYFAMGKDDFLYARVAPTRALFDKVGIRHTYNETAGGHTWINWRDYLADFAPRLFR